jgi:site-specific recombinase XerD
MNQFFSDPQTFVRLQVGPLAAYLELYAARLHAQQFTRASARAQIRLIAQFSRWLDQRQVTAGEVTPQHVQDYLRVRSRQGTRRLNGAAAALTRLLALLREMAVIAAPPDTVVPTPAACVVGEFDQYLQHERGLAAATRICYRAFVSQFLTERFAAGPVELSCLRAADVTTFVQRHAVRPARKRAQLMTTALRAFLRFARQRGDITMDLAAAVPSVANWSFSTLPRGLPAADVQRVLAHCDQGTAVGRRDFAILVLLARLGLRAGEVAALTLEDLDWQAGHFTVRGKGGFVAQLPLPHDVGTALAAYLQHGRPRGTTSRCVFMCGRAPAVSLKGQQTVGSIVRRALARAGITSPHKGAHLFRHSLATELLRHGASLTEIGELLRHRSPDTTALYAKVDLAALRTLAVAWPGGVR